MFHYLFPIGTMGLAPFVAAYTWKAARGAMKRPRGCARFWTKIFAINFATGVVTGIPMEFQFGTNWAAFSERADRSSGNRSRWKGMFAFFLESIFLGVLLYGAKHADAFVAWAGVLVCAGAWLSGFFIVAPTRGCSTRSAIRIAADGTIVWRTSGAVLFSTVRVLAVRARAVRRDDRRRFHRGRRRRVLLARTPRRGDRAAVRARWDDRGLAFSLIAVFPTGDRNGDHVTQRSRSSWRRWRASSTEREAPAGDHRHARRRAQALIDPIYVPSMLSFLSYGNTTPTSTARRVRARAVAARRDDLLCLSRDGRSRYDLRRAATVAVMLLFGAAALDALADALGSDAAHAVSVYRQRGGLGGDRGRAPAVDHLRRDARRPKRLAERHSNGETIFTLIGFAGMYFLLGVLFLYLVLRQIGKGPSYEGPRGVAASSRSC
jgi:cytochrome d ubiquinol oxidase subunit I